MSGKTTKKKVAAALLAAAMMLSAWTVVMAQVEGDDADRGRGRGRDGDRPRQRMTEEERAQRMEQMRQRRQKRIREGLGFTEEQWQEVGPLHEEVSRLQRELMMGRGGMGQGGRDRAPRGRDGGREPGGEGPGRGAGPAGGSDTPQGPSELRKAHMNLAELLRDESADADQIDEALNDYRSARKVVQKELAKAQDELRSHLDPVQEAKLVLQGLLD